MRVDVALRCCEIGTYASGFCPLVLCFIHLHGLDLHCSGTVLAGFVVTIGGLFRFGLPFVLVVVLAGFVVTIGGLFRFGLPFVVVVLQDPSVLLCLFLGCFLRYLC